jgi:hypothetical protein
MLSGDWGEVVGKKLIYILLKLCGTTILCGNLGL